jgi:hypothetical protein
MCSSKPLLKIGTAKAICWNSLGLFRRYLNCIYRTEMPLGLAKNEVCDFFENSCTRVYGNWQKMKFEFFFENSCTRVYRNWSKMMFDIFLKIHVPGSMEIGKK